MVLLQSDYLKAINFRKQKFSRCFILTFREILFPPIKTFSEVLSCFISRIETFLF